MRNQSRATLLAIGSCPGPHRLSGYAQESRDSIGFHPLIEHVGRDVANRVQNSIRRDDQTGPALPTLPLRKRASASMPRRSTNGVTISTIWMRKSLHVLL